MNKMVPTHKIGSLGGNFGEYICLKCGLIAKLVPRGWDWRIFGCDLLICPVCFTLEKKPTEKLSEEDLANKKQEIRNRLNNENK